MGDKASDLKSGVTCPRFRRYDYLQIVCGGASKKFKSAAELVDHEGKYCCRKGKGCPIKKQLEHDGVPIDQPAPKFTPRIIQKRGPVKPTRKQPRGPTVDQLRKEQLVLRLRRAIRESGKSICQVAIEAGLHPGAVNSALRDGTTAMPTLIRLSEHLNVDWSEVIYGKTETDEVGAGDQVCAGPSGENAGSARRCTQLLQKPRI